MNYPYYSDFDFEVLGPTVRSLVTLPFPAMLFALSSTDFFSSSVLTCPFNVTVPSRVRILMLCAWVESDLSDTIALRTCRVRSRSALFCVAVEAVCGG